MYPAQRIPCVRAAEARPGASNLKIGDVGKGAMDESTEGVKVLLGDQRKGVLILTLPIAVALIVQNLNNIVDSYWVADLGQNSMAALGIVYPLYCILIGIGNGLGIGVSAAIARNIGMKDHERANGVAGQGLFLTFLVSVILTAVFVIAAGPIVDMMGGSDMMEECLAYGIPIYLGAFFIILSGVLSGMLRGEGAARRSMVIQVVGAVINIILDPIMIFGMDMGVAGAAWATVAAFVISSLLAFYWYRKGGELYIRLEWKNILRADPALDREILNVGLPESIELTIMNFFNIFLNLFVVVCAGTAGLAVYTMVWRVAYLAVIPAQAMGGAMVAVCSAEYGMREFGMIRDAYYFSIRRSFFMVAVSCAAFALCAGVLADIFIRTEDMEFMHDEMVMFEYTFSVFLPLFSMAYVGSSLMQSIEKAGHAMCNTLARNIAVTFSYWVVAMVSPSLFGIGIALIIVEGLGGIAMLVHGKIMLDRVERRAMPAVPT